MRAGRAGLLDVALDPDFATNRLIYLSYAAEGDGGASTRVARATPRRRAARGPRGDLRAGLMRRRRASTSARAWRFDRDGLPVRHRSASAARTSARRIWASSPARSCASTPTAACRRTTRSSAAPTPGPRSTPTATATRRAWRCIPRPAAVWVAGARAARRRRGQRRARRRQLRLAGDHLRHRLHRRCRSARARDKEGMAQPLHYWVPSIAPSGMAFYTGDAFPEWQGDLFVGALSGELLGAARARRRAGGRGGAAARGRARADPRRRGRPRRLPLPAHRLRDGALVRLEPA